MILGILVNTNKHLNAVVGITEAALADGDEVIIFAMDIGTKLLEAPDFIGLAEDSRVSMAYCSHNSEGFGAKTDGLPESITRGSQYDNAIMNNKADKVIVL